jgi:hypothetical protein
MLRGPPAFEDHPYHTVTDAAGTDEIRDLPTGCIALGGRRGGRAGEDRRQLT